MLGYMDYYFCFFHVSFSVQNVLSIVYSRRESPPTGKILWVSLPCLSSTRRSVSSRKTMREMPQLLSWLALLPKPRYQRWILERATSTCLLESLSCWLD